MTVAEEITPFLVSYFTFRIELFSSDYNILFYLYFSNWKKFFTKFENNYKD